MIQVLQLQAISELDFKHRVSAFQQVVSQGERDTDVVHSPCGWVGTLIRNYACWWTCGHKIRRVNELETDGWTVALLSVIGPKQFIPDLSRNAAVPTCQDKAVDHLCALWGTTLENTQAFYLSRFPLGEYAQREASGFIFHGNPC